MRKCSSNFSKNFISEIVDTTDRKPRSIHLSKFNKDSHHKYNKEEFIKEAEKFLSNIKLKTKEEQISENGMTTTHKPHIKKINIPEAPTKIEDSVRELMNYSREAMQKDATDYLLNLSKITEDNPPTKDKKFNKRKEEIFVEVEETDGLKLIKLDSSKKSYYFHLETKSNFSFTPLMLNDYEDLSPDVSENFFESQLKRYKSNISSKPQSELLDYNDLKKLKHALFYDLCAQMDLDIYIACCAWVYYEFLVKKGVVNRTNKNLYLCVVFLLSLKFYDIDDKRYVDNFYEISYRVFRGKFKKKDILDNEMKVFGNLNFALSLPFEIIQLHKEHAKRFLKSKASMSGSDKNEPILFTN